MKKVLTALVVFAVAASVAAAPAVASIIDGNLTDAGTLRATQDTPTQFGNSTAGTQDSPGGGELDALFGDIVGGTLNLAVAGNLEGNFNKVWIFIDTKAGGENVLDGTNISGGFNEIQNMAGMTFDAGFSPDWAISASVGSGFYSVNFSDLQADTGGSSWDGGGFTDLPAANRTGGFGITHGWDNSNAAGVTDVSAAGALTATTGLELSIDMATAFGDGALTSLRVMAFYGSAGADFMSNQVLPGIGGGGNLAGPSGINFNSIAGQQFVTIPEPATVVLFGLGGLALIRRRR